MMFYVKHTFIKVRGVKTVRRKIENIIVNNGIDLKYVVVGTGETYYSTKRFVFDAKNRKEIVNRTARFAIKYLSKHNLILVWDIEKYRHFRGTVFSVKSKTVFDNFKNGVATKAVEFQSWGEEEVLIYPTDEIEKAILYIKECLK